MDIVFKDSDYKDYIYNKFIDEVLYFFERTKMKLEMERET